MRTPQIPLTRDTNSDHALLRIDLGEDVYCTYHLAWFGRAVVMGVQVFQHRQSSTVGVTARQLRKAQLGLPWELYPTLDDAVADLLGHARRAKVTIGFDALDPKDHPLRPGRRGRDPLLLARVAARYSGLVEAKDPSPLRTLTALLRDRGFEFTEAGVKGLIAEARKRGLLTSGKKPGSAEGSDLTAEGEAVLFKAFEDVRKALPEGVFRDVKTKSKPPATKRRRT